MGCLKPPHCPANPSAKVYKLYLDAYARYLDASLKMGSSPTAPLEPKRKAKQKSSAKQKTPSGQPVEASSAKQKASAGAKQESAKTPVEKPLGTAYHLEPVRYGPGMAPIVRHIATSGRSPYSVPREGANAWELEEVAAALGGDDPEMAELLSVTASVAKADLKKDEYAAIPWEKQGTGVTGSASDNDGFISVKSKSARRKEKRAEAALKRRNALREKKRESGNRPNPSEKRQASSLAEYKEKLTLKANAELDLYRKKREIDLAYRSQAARKTVTEIKKVRNGVLTGDGTVISSHEESLQATLDNFGRRQFLGSKPEAGPQLLR